MNKKIIHPGYRLAELDRMIVWRGYTIYDRFDTGTERGNEIFLATLIRRGGKDERLSVEWFPQDIIFRTRKENEIIYLLPYDQSQGLIRITKAELFSYVKLDILIPLDDEEFIIYEYGIV